MEQAGPDYFVYMILCLDGSLYTGIAKDVLRRLDQHRAGKGARYTRAKGVERLAYQEGPYSRGDALRRERAIKQLPRSAKELLLTSKKPF